MTKSTSFKWKTHFTQRTVTPIATRRLSNPDLQIILIHMSIYLPNDGKKTSPDNRNMLTLFLSVNRYCDAFLIFAMAFRGQ